jgi:CubicO group peptidase (beta-lactamase class C family)
VNAGLSTVELSADRVKKLKERAQQDIDSGVLPSCQYALALGGEVLVHETLGEAPSSARFSIWSSTKPVFSSVVWQLMGEGKLDPSAPVVELWPEFGVHGKNKVTLEHLLLFTAGFPEAKLDLDTIHDRQARVRQMEQWRLDWEPGSQYAYHGLSAHYVLAELVERVTGADHRTALRERVLDPLGLDRLELGVPVEDQGDLQRLVDGGEPATAQEIADALGIPELPPELAAYVEKTLAAGSGASVNSDLYAYQRPDVLAFGMPGAGAISDAASLALFYQALLHDPKGLWDPAVLHDVTTNVRNRLPSGLGGEEAMRTRGLIVQGDKPSSLSAFGAASPGAFGHDGAAGQIAWADPRTGLSFVYLTNGADRHVVRLYRRGHALATAAAACVVPA